MAALKDMLRKALKDSRKEDGRSQAQKLFENYQQGFNKTVGKSLLWKSVQSPILKSAQLVTVVEAFPYFVLVKKLAYSVDGHVSELFYGINYASIIEGKDNVELLEDLR